MATATIFPDGPWRSRHVLLLGQITAHGLEPAAASTGTIATTGGTGMYQSAGGEIRFRGISKTVVLVQVVIDQ